MDEVGDEVLLFEGQGQMKYPLYDEGFEVGEVEIQQQN